MADAVITVHDVRVWLIKQLAARHLQPVDELSSQLDRYAVLHAVSEVQLFTARPWGPALRAVAERMLTAPSRGFLCDDPHAVARALHKIADIRNL